MTRDIFEKFRNVGEKLIGAMVVAALLIANYGVFARFVLEISVAWTDEILRAIFIWLIFICSALAFNTDTLISLDLVEERLKGKLFARRCLEIVQAIFAAVFSVFCTYNGFFIVLKQFRNAETTPVVDIPLYLISLGFLVGASMMFLISIGKLYVAVVQLMTGSDQ